MLKFIKSRFQTAGADSSLPDDGCGLGAIPTKPEFQTAGADSSLPDVMIAGQAFASTITVSDRWRGFLFTGRAS